VPSEKCPSDNRPNTENIQSLLRLPEAMTLPVASQSLAGKSKEIFLMGKGPEEMVA